MTQIGMRRLRRIVFGLLCMTIAAGPAAAEEAWPGEAVKAAEAYDAGSYEAAIAGYEDAIAGGDYRAELPFNLGAALFRQALAEASDAADSSPGAPGGPVMSGPPGAPGSTGAPPSTPNPADALIDAAVKSFDRAAGTGDASLRARALSNTGTLEATRGNATEAIELYKEALRLDPSDARSRYNLEFLLSQPPPSESDSTSNEGEPGDEGDEGESQESPQDQPSDDPPDPNQDPPGEEGDPPPTPGDDGEQEPQDSPSESPDDSPTPPDLSEGQPSEPEGMSEDAARRELDRLEELERELLKELMARRRQRITVEKDW